MLIFDRVWRQRARGRLVTTTPEAIRDNFIDQEAKYKAFAACIEQLVLILLDRQGITVHSTSHRVKTRQSLYEKLKRPGKNYGQLADVTDIAGLRLITYLPEDVDRVAALIELEFAVDRLNSIDKRLSHDPDRFGYASLHKVCSLTDARLALAEYAPYRQLKCEIQIRTILQHAWAEIEHDLGYKSGIGVPTHLQRRFSRLAALLETADEEFMRLKNELTAYAKDVRNRVATSAPGVALDKITLALFVQTSELLRSIEAGNAWPGQPELSPASTDVLDQYVEHFKQLGVAHVDSLAAALERHKKHITSGMSRCQQVDYGPEYCNMPTERGWPFWMLIQLLCAERPTLADTVEAFKKIGLWIPDSVDAYATSLRAIVRDEQGSLGQLRARDYKSVYVTIGEEGTGGSSFALTLQGDRWVWENVTVTDDQVIIDGQPYPIESKNPLWACVIHKGKTFMITW